MFPILHLHFWVKFDIIEGKMRNQEALGVRKMGIEGPFLSAQFLAPNF